MLHRSCILIAGVAALSMQAVAQNNLADLASGDPPRMAALFESLNLDNPDLALVKSAVSKKAWAEACEALLAYYRVADRPAFSAAPIEAPRDNAAIERADAALNDTFTFYDQTAKVPRRPDGGLHWDYTGPNDDKEWAWALNRHFHLDWLLDAYRMTGDAKYAAAWDAHVRDWIVQNPYAEPNQNPLVWRGLETFFRVRAWARGFYTLQAEPALTPVTRILLLSSIPGHARYLRTFHKPSTNWIAMELNGLATAGLAWPEFRDADAWVQYSVDRLTKELDAQVYPDGAQMELTASYHRVTMLNFQTFQLNLNQSGRAVPDAFAQTIDRMWDYLAYTLTPTGYSPLNNDSDLQLNGPRIAEAAKELDRPDWTFIATNGASGTRPGGPPSRAFPWAGQLVMRSGWETGSDWAFFDAGPAGIAHQHADKLHLSVAARGRDVLVDAGRYTYVNNAWRRYFVGTSSHNTLLVDGRGQATKPQRVSDPAAHQLLTAPGYDLGYGVYNAGYGDLVGLALHERMVYYKRGEYWLVLDRVESDRPRAITALWHFHPDCAVSLDELSAASTDPGVGNVRLVPSKGAGWSVRLVSGQEDPEIQGWWSREYNHKTPATAAIYERSMESSDVMAWLIVPSDGPPPDAALRVKTDGDWVECRVRIGQSRDRVRLLFSASPRRE